MTMMAKAKWPKPYNGALTILLQTVLAIFDSAWYSQTLIHSYTYRRSWRHWAEPVLVMKRLLTILSKRFFILFSSLLFRCFYYFFYGVTPNSLWKQTFLKPQPCNRNRFIDFDLFYISLENFPSSLHFTHAYTHNGFFFDLVKRSRLLKTNRIQWNVSFLCSRNWNKYLNHGKNARCSFHVLMEIWIFIYNYCLYTAIVLAKSFVSGRTCVLQSFTFSIKILCNRTQEWCVVFLVLLIFLFLAFFLSTLVFSCVNES